MRMDETGAHLSKGEGSLFDCFGGVVDGAVHRRGLPDPVASVERLQLCRDRQSHVGVTGGGGESIDEIITTQSMGC